MRRKEKFQNECLRYCPCSATMRDRNLSGGQDDKTGSAHSGFDDSRRYRRISASKEGRWQSFGRCLENYRGDTSKRPENFESTTGLVHLYSDPLLYDGRNWH